MKCKNYVFITIYTILTFLLFNLLFNNALTSNAANGTGGAFFSDPFHYNIEDDCITITDISALSEFQPIPSEIDGYPVTKIANRGVYGSFNMDSITEIPDSVQVVETEAFLGLVGYGFPDVMIPKSVTEIGEYAFGYTDYTGNEKMYQGDEDVYYDGRVRIENMIIRGYTGTAAESYANENGFTFIALDDQKTTTEVSTATTESQTFTTTTSSTLCGDINLDGAIDISDAVLLQKYAAEMVELNQQQRLNGDCNADGSTDAQDVLSLLRFLVRLTEVLPDVIAN